MKKFIIAVTISLFFTGCVTLPPPPPPKPTKTTSFEESIEIQPVAIKAITILKKEYLTYKAADVCSKNILYAEYLGKEINGITIHNIRDIYVEDIPINTKDPSKKYKHICSVIGNGIEYKLDGNN